MDLIASTVAAVVVPPLALMATRIEPNTDRRIAGYANSHHLFQQAMIHAMRRECPSENEVRQATQIHLTNVFLEAFRTSEAPETLYTACTDFTRGYLISFMPSRANSTDVRFAPYDEVRYSGYENPVTRSACEHLAGLIYYDEGGARQYGEVLGTLKNLKLAEILSKYREVHLARGMACAHSLVQLD
jgi:hypothetical protein